MSGAAAGDLSKRTVHALKWNYAGNAVRAGAQFLIGIVLARLLGPTAFGTVAVAWLFVGLGTLVADLGLSPLVIQRPVLLDRDVRFVFTLQVVLGGGLSVAGAAIAGAVAAFFQRPDAAPVIRAMSLLFLLQAAALTPLALLRRNLDFRGAQLINVKSYLLGYVGVGISLAAWGAGAWSLVAAQLTQAALSSVLALRAAPVSLRPAFTPASPDLAAFGRSVIGANLSNYGISNLDSFVVGRLFGVTDLGLYSRSLALVQAPVSSVVAGMQGVLLAACSRAQDDVARLRRAFLGATAAVTAASLPVFAAIATIPATVVGGFYGPSWERAAPILVPLALAMPVHAVLALAGPVLTATNRAAVEFRVQLVVLALLAAALLVAGTRSPVAVAWAVLGVYVVRWAFLTRAVLRVVGCGWAEVLLPLRWWAACAAATAAAAFAADAALAGWPSAGRLGAAVTASALALVISLRVVARRALAGPLGEVVGARGRLPAVVQAWLRIGEPAAEQGGGRPTPGSVRGV